MTNRNSNSINQTIRTIVLPLLGALLIICSGCNNSEQGVTSLSQSVDFSDLSYSADRANLDVKIIKEGFSSPSFAGIKPYFDETGATMYPLICFKRLFEGNVSYVIDDKQVTFTKNVLDVITTVTITADSNVLTKDGETIIMNTIPVLKDETIFFPLEYVATSLSYGVYWNNNNKEVSFYQYTQVYVYVWNESKYSLPWGTRYAYTISGDRILDIKQLRKKAKTNYQEIKTVLEKLPDKTKVLAILFYHVKGFDIVYQSYFDLECEVLDMGLRIGYTTYCLVEIPPFIKDPNVLADYSFSQTLFSFNETPLYNAENHQYRFSFIPAFTNTYIVRIRINEDNTADIYYKPGDEGVFLNSLRIIKQKHGKLNQQETQDFLDKLEKEAFWDLPFSLNLIGVDGYYVLIEGIKDGHYHVVEDWVPEYGDPLYNLEAYFNYLIEQKFGKNPSWEIYHPDSNNP